METTATATATATEKFKLLIQQAELLDTFEDILLVESLKNPAGEGYIVRSVENCKLLTRFFNNNIARLDAQRRVKAIGAYLEELEVLASKKNETKDEFFINMIEGKKHQIESEISKLLEGSTVTVAKEKTNSNRDESLVNRLTRADKEFNGNNFDNIKGFYKNKNSTGMLSTFKTRNGQNYSAS